MQQKAEGTDLLESPNNPAKEEHQSHRQGHVQVGVGATKKRILNLETMRRLMAPSDCSKAGNQANPIREENKDKDGREEPECLMHQMMPNNPIQKFMQTFDHPFPEVLRSFWNGLHITSG